MKMGKIEETVLEILEAAIEKYGTAAALSQATGVSTANISRWRKGRTPRVGEIAPILEVMGASLALPADEPAKEVCFVHARVVSAGEHVAPPQSEEYIAAPVVGEVGAGPGYLPEEDIKSWFLAYKNLPAIRHRRNLIAVEIGPSSTSMQPTLNPGDIVLVDRDDRDVAKPGHMMLVLDPDDGSGMVKRVSVVEKKDDFQITYYSDNGSKWPPMIYSLKHDFEMDWDKAVVGRVIWSWSDVRDK